MIPPSSEKQIGHLDHRTHTVQVGIPTHCIGACLLVHRMGAISQNASHFQPTMAPMRPERAFLPPLPSPAFGSKALVLPLVVGLGACSPYW